MSAVIVRSAVVIGIEAHPVDVEVSLTSQLPGVKTVGLPDTALREGAERIWLALRNSNLMDKRPAAVINLAPAELRKAGAGFELPSALAILIADGKLKEEALSGLIVIGELSLSGAVRPVRGVLSVACMASDLGARALVVPRANAEEASAVAGLDIVATGSLQELVSGLHGDTPMELYRRGPRRAARRPMAPDLEDVRGQHQARRAAEIAAAGGHNLLFIGPPGSGKTMIARRLPGILPPMQLQEALETTRVFSAAGTLHPGAGLLAERPFRAPHHTISYAGLIGGYLPPRPGELSLAHNGVLFLDELGEFRRHSLESLREPLETGVVQVVRGGLRATFPARAVLVAATNPCPCGYHGDRAHGCDCSPGEIHRYRARLSGPLLDRIDLHVEVPRLRATELSGRESGESTGTVAGRVRRARELQRKRGAACNALLGERATRELVTLGSEARRALEAAVEQLGLSPRAWSRLLRVARTIADLDETAEVSLPHVLEALHYRSFDRRCDAG